MKNFPILKDQSKTQNAASRKKAFSSSSKACRTFGRFIECSAATLFSLGALALWCPATAQADLAIDHDTTVASGTSIDLGTATLYVTSNSGTPTLTINGGTVTDGTVNIGYIGNGAVSITSGTWANSGTILFGNLGTGNLTMSGGTIIDYGVFLGVWGGGCVANVSGGTWNTLAGTFILGNSSSATLNLIGGTVNCSGTFLIANNAGSTGVLNIGTGDSAGVLTAAVVKGGNGTATVNFNHTGDYTFATILTGNLTVNKLGSGTTNLTGSNSYTGSTTISQGTLVLGDGTTANTSIAASSALNVASGASFVVNLTANNPLALSGTLTNSGTTTFIGASSAGNVSIINNATVSFQDTATAGSSTIATSGSANFVIFSGSSTAGSSTISVSGSSNWVGFTESSSGGTAAITLADPTSSLVFFSGSASTNTLGSLAGSGTTILGGETVTVGGNDQSTTYSGVIADSGTVLVLGMESPITGTNSSIVKTGTGTWTLTGSNSYTGSTTVSQGTLVLGDGVTANTSIAASSGVNVGENGTFTVNLTADTPFALSGTFTNNGVTNFIGASSAGSATIVNNSGDGAGVNFWGTSTAGSATITNNTNGMLNFFGSSSAGSAMIVNSGSSSGVGFGVNSTAGNATILSSGTQSYVAFVENGNGGNAAVTLADPTSMLIFYSGSASANSLGSLAGNGTTILGGETVTIGGNGQSTTYSGVIADSGLFAGDVPITGTDSSLVKTGTGTFNLTGTASYTGPTVIEQGTFLDNGVVTGNVTVQGGILGGSGYIGGTVVNSSIVSPGNSPGTLTIGGDYTQTTSGTLYIEVASASVYDRLIVGGVATLAGTLKVDFLGGYTPEVGQTYTFLSAAGGVSGTFTSIDTNTMINLVYTGTSASFMDVVATQGKFADISGLTPNELAVAAGLDQVAGNSHESKLVSYLDSISKTEVPGKLEKIVPTDLMPIFDAIINSTQVQDFNLERRMSELQAGTTGASTSGLSLTDGRGGQTYQPDGKQIIKPDGKTAREPEPLSDAWGFFVNGSGEFVNVGSTAQALGSDFTTAGVSAGADYRLGQNAAVGLMAGYANTTADGSHERDAVKLDAGKLALYATAFSDGFFLNGAFGSGMASYDTRRKTLGGYAYGSPDGNDINAMLGTGYTYRQGGWSLGPIGAVRYSLVMLDGYTEHGSLAPLTYGDQSESSMRSTLGGQISYAIECGKTTTVTPQLRVQWQHEYLDPSRGLGASFLPNGDGAFTVHGPDTGRDSALIDAGVNVRWSPTVSVYGYYTGDIGRANYTSHAVNAGVQLSF